ncbi:MAG: PLP-dependent aspartate aminotransferase family protein [Gemmatimonadota bacterium]|nr:PLP-dependent aspartate aminotransferase family protein [Gemmatimonadota bacterium]
MPGPTDRFGTRCVHAGQSPEAVTGAIATPVFQTSTYVQEGVGRHKGYEYARLQNPTREAAEANIAALEGGAHGIAFSSGLAAIECLAKVVAAGGRIVSEENLYGGAIRMFTQVLDRLGIEVVLVDSRDPGALGRAVRPGATRLVYLETPTNPLMRVTDIAAAAEVARAAGALLCVDNTFASPYNQTPLALGADVVVHSTTKYLNGHSDVLGGILVLDDDALAEEIHFVRKSTGPVPGPMDSWLTLRGTKTLHLRMPRHNENGMLTAEFLRDHPAVRAVHYPGLPSHPDHALAARQMSGFSGMVSAELAPDDAKRLAEGTRIFRLAESLGGVESMVCIPSLMTHASVPEPDRRRMGITDGLVRFSAGIEDGADLIEDLDRALRAGHTRKDGPAGPRRPARPPTAQTRKDGP